jgi:hypothetical protein
MTMFTSPNAIQTPRELEEALGGILASLQSAIADASQRICWESTTGSMQAQRTYQTLAEAIAATEEAIAAASYAADCYETTMDWYRV